MLILIPETGELGELVYLDPETGADLVLGYFQQTKQLDKYFSFCQRQQRYLCSQLTFDWCSDLIKDFKSMNGGE